MTEKPSSHAWGDEQTRFFFELTPDRVLDAVESSGLVCTGRCVSLNSFENRVYDVEVDLDEGRQGELAHWPGAIPSRRVVKFYRPGRWTSEQILEEHQFILDLAAAEIPAIPPIAFEDGQTLHQMKDTGIWFAVFPKVGGRAPDELSEEQMIRVGRLLGRIHAVGSARKFKHRISLTPMTYGLSNLEYLLTKSWIPLEWESRYTAAVRELCKRVEPGFSSLPLQRVHGDCHLGNLLWNDLGPFFLDFDDCLQGPAVQDLWLLMPGRMVGESDDPLTFRLREALLDGYEQIHHLDRRSLRWTEALRALRWVHYTAWIARRWEDPAFQKAFPQFESHRYWQDQTEDLEKQLQWIEKNILSS